MKTKVLKKIVVIAIIISTFSLTLFVGPNSNNTVQAKRHYKASTLRLMAAIIHSEAGDQCKAGKRAVGIVIMNRVKSRQFPNSVKGVVYQSGQFSPVRNGSLARSFRLYDRGKLKSEKKAAKYALSGKKKVKYRGRRINLKGFCFFSGYVPGARLTIQGHQFK